MVDIFFEFIVLLFELLDESIVLFDLLAFLFESIDSFECVEMLKMLSIYFILELYNNLSMFLFVYIFIFL